MNDKPLGRVASSASDRSHRSNEPIAPFVLAVRRDASSPQHLPRFSQGVAY